MYSDWWGCTLHTYARQACIVWTFNTCRAFKNIHICAVVTSKPFNLTCTLLEIALSSFVFFSLSSLAASDKRKGDRERGREIEREGEGGRGGRGRRRGVLRVFCLSSFFQSRFSPWFWKEARITSWLCRICSTRLEILLMAWVISLVWVHVKECYML